MEGVVRALRALANREAFVERYGASKDQEVILFPVPLPIIENVLRKARGTCQLLLIGFCSRVFLGSALQSLVWAYCQRRPR